MTFSLAGVAMPTFVIGILLIYVFSVECKSWAPALGLPADWCFPSFGRGETVKLGWLDHRPAHGDGPEGASCCRPSPSRCSR